MEKKINEFLSSSEVVKLAKNTRDLYRYILISTFLPSVQNQTIYQKADFDHKREPIVFHTKDVLESFTEHLEDKNAAGTTIQQYITVVKIFLKWNKTPVEYTYRISNKERKANALKKMNRWFDEDDIEKCCNYKHNNRRDELIVHLLIETGMRIQELSDIKAKDIDVDDRTIRIKESKTKPRVVFFSPEARRRFLRFGLTDKLFPTKDQIYNIVRNMLEDLDLKDGKDGRGPHTFRHYCATYLFYIGDMRLEDVARLLGDTPDVIEQQYLHPTPKMLRQRTDKAMGWS